MATHQPPGQRHLSRSRRIVGSNAQASARRGATLIDLALCLALISILSAIAFPRVARLVDGIHVRGSATEIHSLFTAARHHAITRSERVTVEIDAERGHIALRSDTDTIRSRAIAVVHGVTLSSNRPSFTYSPIGIGYGAGNMTVIIGRNGRFDSVFVSRLGRVRLD